jgi:K+-sensing histidine kinase KdpD
VPVLSPGTLYVFAVLPIAIAWGLAFAVGVPVASMLVFNLLFLPPVHSFTLSASRNWFALAVYVVTSAMVSELAARSRRHATESALLAEIARSLLERRSVSDELDRIAAGAANALGAGKARIELGHPSAELRHDPEAMRKAEAQHVTQIVIGKSRRSPLRTRLGGSLVEAVLRGTSGIDVLVVDGQGRTSDA